MHILKVKFYKNYKLRLEVVFDSSTLLLNSSLPVPPCHVWEPSLSRFADMNTFFADAKGLDALDTWESSTPLPPCNELGLSPFRKSCFVLGHENLYYLTPVSLSQGPLSLVIALPSHIFCLSLSPGLILGIFFQLCVAPISVMSGVFKLVYPAGQAYG